MDIAVQQDLFNNEYNIDNIKVLNRYLTFEKELILCINIRSLNANFSKLQVFLYELEIQPNIVCTETWNLEHSSLFNIVGYKMFYNNSKINKSDGVIIYIKDNITEITEIIQIGKIKIINSKISLENKKKLLLSSIYRSHDIHKTEFLMNMKNHIEMNKTNKNNIIVGDFNIDILNQDIIDQEFLQVMLENGYCPGLNNITKPSNQDHKIGTCIHNFYLKLDKLRYNTFTLNIPLNDHYPIFMALKGSMKNDEQTTFKKINYK